MSLARSTIISEIRYYFGADYFKIDESHRDLPAMIEMHRATHRYEVRLFAMRDHHRAVGSL
jgi:hypothetical protein